MVPSIYHKYSSKNMLVQERVYGINIDDIKQLKEHNINLKVLAKEGFNLFFTQAFEHKFFHADLHRGNLFVDPANPEKPKILTIDFGIMGTLTETDQVYLAKNFIAFFNRDYYECAKLHQQSGWLPADSDVNAFATAIRTFSEPMWQQPLKHISMADTLMQLFNTAQKFNMHVQPQLLLLQKSLVCIEGISRNLDPDLNMWEVAKPFFQKWLHNRSKFITRLKNVVKNTPVWLEKASKLIENKQTEKVIVYKNSYSHVIIAFILGLTLASLYTIPTTTLVTLP
jgi:ubiquinone biosynthesis protein